MLTSWYNGSFDLAWLQYWADGFVAEQYAAGYAMHLIIFDDDPEDGTPCGRQYPISDRIEEDMEELAQIFAGSMTDPPLYVTLFTEFQTYPCEDNQWNGSEQYYTLLQQKMLSIRDIFHAHAANAQVSIGWGGWQARWDDPGNGGGRALFGYFSDVMNAMDFQSFQAMQGDSNESDVEKMTAILGDYGPVMLAHHKPDGFHPDIFYEDITAMLTDSYLDRVTADGLFAWSFMDNQELSASEETFQIVKAGVERYGREP